MSISFIKFEKNIITFEVECSKGTYIRVLCEDIAEKLGTVGLMNNLTRTKVNAFDIEKSYTLEEIKNSDNLSLITIEDIFNTKPSMDLNNRKTELFLNGVKLSVDDQDDIYRIYNNTTFLGLGILSNKLLKRDVIIDNQNNKV